MKYKIITSMLIAAGLLLSGCGEKKDPATMQDGTYTAQMSEYSHGWREFVTITVKNGEVVTAEYNAENSSGFIKSWDTAYMNNMKTVTGTYPNEYTRYYAAFLKGQKDVPEIDALTGASNSGANFKRLSDAVVNKAKQGDSTIAFVETEEKE
ncbi:MAG: FMN-binding protein [Eubacterium sp.]|nr:FMN-binding protein [Eubacterium sp.]